MKNFKILLLVLIFPLLSASSAHKFYVSITKIEFVQEKSSLQIITKIFTDDMENALRKKYTASLFLDSQKETDEVDTHLKQYLLKNIVVHINGKSAKLQYLGKEYDTDMVIAYLEVTGIAELKTLDIQNKVLMEMFPEQKNIIHLKTAKSRRSLILEKESPSGKLEFNR